MKSRKLIIIIIAGVLFIGLAVLVYARVKSNLDASNKQTNPKPTVELTSTKRGNLQNKLSYTGDVLASEQANIYSRVAGNIQKIYVNTGDFVRQGKLLAEIDRSIYLQALRQTDGLYKQAKATVDNNRVNYDRNKELYEKGLIPKADFDNARTTLTVSEAQVEAALANFRNAQTTLSYCTIAAPFSGYITKRLLDRGSYIAIGGNSQSTVIFVISDISQVKVMVNVLEKDIPILDMVEEANITSGTYPDETFKAVVKKMSQLIDVNTRTMPVEIGITNKDGKLKPGMFVNIELVIKKVENAVILPSQCVLKDDKGSFVYQVGSDSTVQAKYVEVGLQQDNNTQIISGLGDDDKVVSSGQALLKPGIKVRIAK
jgi:membrane fusion protein (multidrug efflux system)